MRDAVETESRAITLPPSDDPLAAARVESLRTEPPSRDAASPCRPAVPVDRPESDAAVLWLRRLDQVFVAALLAAVLVLLAVHWVRLSRWGTRPVEIVRQTSQELEYQLDINTATWVEWMQLDGIGDTLARRIVAEREQHGPFRSLDDLRRVKGIGPKTLEKLRPWIRVTSDAESQEPIHP